MTMVMMTRAKRPMLASTAPKFNLALPPRELRPVHIQTSPAAAAAARLTPKSPQFAPFEANEILPGLFLGSWIDADSAAELQRRGIRRVLNVAAECEVSESCTAVTVEKSPTDAKRWLRVQKIDLVDHSDTDLAGCIDDALRFIHEGHAVGEGVLVHCRHGVSRSAAIVLAYLMAYGQNPRACNAPMRYDAAFDLVKSKRPHISPNLGFTLTLRDIDDRRWMCLGAERPEFSP